MEYFIVKARQDDASRSLLCDEKASTQSISFCRASVLFSHLEPLVIGRDILTGPAPHPSFMVHFGETNHHVYDLDVDYVRR
jgi:hypothetical protein